MYSRCRLFIQCKWYFYTVPDIPTKVCSVAGNWPPSWLIWNIAVEDDGFAIQCSRLRIIKNKKYAAMSRNMDLYSSLRKPNFPIQNTWEIVPHVRTVWGWYSLTLLQVICLIIVWVSKLQIRHFNFFSITLSLTNLYNSYMDLSRFILMFN